MIVGSKTGQHVVCFIENLIQLTWFTSDVEENNDDINLILQTAGLSNPRFPVKLDVKQSGWPEFEVDIVFSVNTVHIISWDEVKA